MVSRFIEDIAQIKKRDPAAPSGLQILLTYPGLHAIWGHRLAHWLWLNHAKGLARILAYTTRRNTGIEIHPGATIGRRLVIDHGMGIVIGESAVVGDDVLMYHGVTLGGRRPWQLPASRLRDHKSTRGSASQLGEHNTSSAPSVQMRTDRLVPDEGNLAAARSRHPRVGNRVVLGTGARLLGTIEVGDDSVIGANAVVIATVPPHSLATGVPATVRPLQRANEIEVSAYGGDWVI